MAALLFLFTFSALSADQQTYGTLVVDTVISVYDGDTFRCTIKILHPLIGRNVSIRLSGVDTPEIRDKRPHIKKLARLAKYFTQSMLRKAERIELRNTKRGKYFRIVADVYCDGKNLSQSLIDAGLAKPYYGGKKSEW